MEKETQETKLLSQDQKEKWKLEKTLKITSLCMLFAKVPL
jgi:hypothetical protein